MTLKKNKLRPDNPCPCGSGRKRERCCSGKQDGGVARRHINPIGC